MPPKGQAYADPRLLQGLGLKAGDDLEFGAGTLRIAGIIEAEPDTGGDLLTLSPPCWSTAPMWKAQACLAPAAASTTG